MIDIFLISTSIILITLYISWFVLALIPSRKMQDYRPSISLIIPAYNEEKNIGETLQNVLSAHYPKKFEIIVVDDGSKDKTAEIVKKFKIKLLKGMHQGKAKAVNLAMKHARGTNQLLCAELRGFGPLKWLLHN